MYTEPERIKLISNEKKQISLGNKKGNGLEQIRSIPHKNDVQPNNGGFKKKPKKSLKKKPKKISKKKPKKTSKKKPKKTSKKKSPKIHKGPRGGVYIIRKGRKIYQ